MKTVTGKILSSSPISVSKAAKIITNFAATDNGASQAISAYLRRASASFIELKQLHRELQKPSRSDRKQKKSKSETTVEDARESSLEPSLFNLTRGDVELSQEASHGNGDAERKKHKKKNNKEMGDSGGKIVIEDRKSKEGKSGGKTVTGQSKVKTHKKEKSGKKIETLEENGMENEKGEIRDEEKREGDKKKGKSRDIEDEIGNNASSEPMKKKRKSRDIEDEIGNNASSEPVKKKKKIKN